MIFSKFYDIINTRCYCQKDVPTSIYLDHCGFDSHSMNIAYNNIPSKSYSYFYLFGRVLPIAHKIIGCHLNNTYGKKIAVNKLFLLLTKICNLYQRTIHTAIFYLILLLSVYIRILHFTRLYISRI